jgi:hypothetical protein
VYGGISSHVFAFLTDAKPTEVAGKIQGALTKHWHETYAKPVRDELIRAVGAGDWVATFDRQAAPFPTENASGWMEFYWVALPYEGNTHGEVYIRARLALSQRKSLRHFPQVEEHGVKCSLTGAQSELPFTQDQMKAIRTAISDNPEGIILRKNEHLGTLAMIKRLWPEVTRDERAQRFLSTRAIAADNPELDKKRDDNWFEETLPKEGREVEGYLAILHMDGDKMGETLSKLTTLDQHQTFSRRLADFAQTAQGIVEHKNHGGEAARLVYSGGDDVLALVPLKHALACARALREAFGQQVGMGMTASAGIAITPAKYPLDFGLELARDAEKLAKEKYGRNAIAITEAYGGERRRTSGGRWPVLEHVEALQAAFDKPDDGIRVLSTKFPFDLAEIAHLMQGGEVTPQMREAEMRRVLRRRLDDRLTPAHASEWVAYVANAVLSLANTNWHDAANWAMLARFLASGGERTNDNEGQA